MTSPPTPSFWQHKPNWVLLGFLVIAAYFLVTEHAAHLAGILPWLLLLACPLLHLFMHRGHGGHRHDNAGDAPRDAPSREERR